MKRGVIFLSVPEVEFLAKLLPQAKARASYSTDSSEIKIQLSEDEVETYLDSLPMPHSGENSVVSSLRNKLTNFLNSLRG